MIIYNGRHCSRVEAISKFDKWHKVTEANMTGETNNNLK